MQLLCLSSKSFLTLTHIIILSIIMGPSLYSTTFNVRTNYIFLIPTTLGNRDVKL